MIESYRSAVALAECDEMGHMNIQHYAARAEAAGAVLAALGGVDAAMPGWLHLRFHREMRAGDRLAVRSGMIVHEGAHEGADVLQHLIENAGTRLVTATCLAGYREACPPAPAADPAPEALPRSIGGQARDGFTGPHVTHLAPVMPADTGPVGAGPDGAGPDGAMTFAGFLARVSRAQAHLWALAGLDRRAQADAGLGTASLELRVTRHAPALPGAALRIHTSFVPPAGKVLRYRHEAENAATGETLFTAEGAGVVIDLATRRAVVPPLSPTQFA